MNTADTAPVLSDLNATPSAGVAPPTAYVVELG